MAALHLDEQAIFEAARKMDSPEVREAYLRRVCGDDAAIGQRVRALLKAYEESASFLESPAAPLGVTVDEPIRERPGAVIGPYKLLQEIGEGGMGTVWMAEQTQPVQRKVALKIIKAGMDSRHVLARFEAERQALALMDHPNIAKVLDAGATPEGRPYFVMELVKGQPITKYCDERRLTPKERLELFVPVCQAIQHAHQKGVIHRDVKPSNVLVAPYDGKPVVKVIDFGVAKAAGQRLTDKTLFTEFGAVVGTLEYMSPEQAELNNQDIDTRSDIYSLGVLLYELLTGTTPLNRKRLKDAAFVELLRVVREVEPPRPSTRLSESRDTLPTVSAQRQTEPGKLTRLVRGELDWIVMKALEKDRNRRYDTANGLARDVERYLRDEPVLACPPSAGYRLRKFARRNRAALGVAGLVLLCIALVGGVGGWVLRDRAARQRDADGRALDALKAAEPRLGDGRPWDPALVSAVQRVEAELESGALGPEVRRRAEQLRQDMRMLVDLDEIRLRQAESKDGQMFDSAGSAARYRAAFSAYALDMGTLGPAEAAARVQSSAIREALVTGLDAWMQVGSADGEERVRVRAIADGADDNAWRRTFREAALAGDAERLKSIADRGLAFQGAHALPAGDVEKLKALAAQPEALDQPPGVLASLGSVLEGAGAATEAAALLQRAQERHPEDFWLNYNLGHVLLFKLSMSAEAVGYFRAAVAVRPGSAEARSILGLALFYSNDSDGAIAAYREAIALDPKFAIAHINLADALSRKGDYDAAVAAYSECLRLQPDIAEAWAKRGRAYAHLKQWDKALADYSEAVKRDPKDAAAWHNRGQALNELGQPEQALADYSKALEMTPENAEAWLNRGEAYYELHRYEKAVAEFSKAVEVDPKLAWAWCGRYLAHRQLMQWDEGVADVSKALELEPDDPAFQGMLAWLLATHPDATKRDPRRAVELAGKAVQAAPADPHPWHSLGAARYRAGDGPGAVAALQEALKCCEGVDEEVGRGGWFVRGRTLFFLAMAQQKIGHGPEAREAYERALAWLKTKQKALQDNPGNADEFRRFRAEAEEALEIQKEK
jgi:serine/threonine protein kinase/tetratricopeptide (TPR) repeat protein